MSAVGLDGRAGKAVTRARARRRPTTLRDLVGRLLRTGTGSGQNTVLMPAAGSGILKTWKAAGALAGPLQVERTEAIVLRVIRPAVLPQEAGGRWASEIAYLSLDPPRRFGDTGSR